MTASAITAVDVSGFTTDAKFRTWGSTISAALTTAGLTNTADTGQINWTTVTRATGANTKQGYEIWRFNDTLQATAPIFFRIDYGSGGHASGQNPSTWLTVGTGSDGAGTITGVGMVVAQSWTSATASNNAASNVGAAYSTSAGACSILGGLNIRGANTEHGAMWNIARTCDSSGAPTGSGVRVFRNIGVALTSPSCRGATFSPASALAATNPGIGALGGNTSNSSGTTVQLFKEYANLTTLFPCLGAVGYIHADITALTQFSAAPFGSTTHNYLALGTSVTNSSECSISFASFTAAFIWE